jgi:Fe-Mn family superoxide dismutase
MGLLHVAKRIAGLKSPIQLSYKEISGLVSQTGLAEHYKLYEGYWNTLCRTEQGIQNVSPQNDSASDSEFRALKLAESYAAAGVLLHELYFLNLTPISIEPNINSAFHIAIINHWGSFDQFLDELRGTAIAARGWAVLGVCEIDPGYLKIFLLDDHNIGACFGYSPLLVIDSFNHSYWMDWGANIQGYVNTTIKHLNWPEIEKRYQNCIL